MKPERALLQKPMDPGQATLINGVRCGSALRGNEYTGGSGWSSIIHFTGDLLSRFPSGPHAFQADVGFLGVRGTVKRYTGLPEDIDNSLGRSIIALRVNKALDQVALLVDSGSDEEDPNAQECEVMVGAVEDLLTQDLIGVLQRRGHIR